MSIVTNSPDRMVPRSHRMMFDPCGRRVQVPWLEVAEMNSTLSGRIPLTLQARSEGSMLVFVMVKVTGSPRTTLSGYAVISRDALCADTVPAVSATPQPRTTDQSFHILLLPSPPT